MTVSLAKDVEEFVADQVRSGACSNPEILVNDVLRSIRDQQHQPFQVTPELENWLLKAANSPATPLTARDFTNIRQRVQRRIQRSGG